MRAAEDELQMKSLLLLRSFSGNQVSNNLLQTLIQNNTLNKKDFEECNTKNENKTWFSAPLAVTSNCERNHLMFLRAQVWAKLMGQPIITWNLQCRGAFINYLTENNCIEEIYHNQSGLIGIFVQGAMSYITENINPTKGLANGTAVYMHSLTFSDEDMKSDYYKQFIKLLEVAKPGEQISINKIIPTFINVEFIMPEELKPFWDETETLCTNKVIIPIGYKSRSEKIIIDINVNGQNYHNITIKKEKEHRVELSFIITFHKLQGKTLPKLIIQLNERPFSPHITYNGFLVALSRVKFRSDLRIMPINSGNDLLYLKKLAPDENLQVWLGGYNSDGDWSKEKCKEFYDHKKLILAKKNFPKQENNYKKKRKVHVSESILKINKGDENTCFTDVSLITRMNQNTNLTPVTEIVNEIKNFNKEKEEITKVSNTIIHNKNLLHINLLNTSEDATGSKKYLTQEYNTQWRNKFNLLNNTTYSTTDSQFQKIWHIAPHHIQMTEQYMEQATAMIDNGQPNSFMPDYNSRFTHFPSDALSLRNHTWLTGTIMDVFLYSMTINVTDGTIIDAINVFNTSFYAILLNTYHNDASLPEWNTYNYTAVTNYTTHFTRTDILKTTIIPIHIPSHWLLCIIEPSTKTLYIIDSLRHQNLEIIQNICMWFNSELERLNYNTCPNLEFHIYNWKLVTSNNLPSHVPRQQDSSSCGVFVLMCAFYWYKYNRLPDFNLDWNSNDINSSRPNLRQFILYFIIKTVNNEYVRSLDLS